MWGGEVEAGWCVFCGREDGGEGGVKSCFSETIGDFGIGDVGGSKDCMPAGEKVSDTVKFDDGVAYSS